MAPPAGSRAYETLEFARPALSGARAVPTTYIAVVGATALLGSTDGVVGKLRQLGAEVRTLDYRVDPGHLVEAMDEELGIRPRAVVFESLDRPELAVVARRALRRHGVFDAVSTLLVVDEQHVTSVETAGAFDDFLVAPYSAAELYARIRALDRRPHAIKSAVSYRIGEISIDSNAREVRVGERPVTLTRKEYALLVQLCEHGGRAISREQLLADIWGARYAGGRRTVDIHVRRLRAKLGPSFALDTLRGWGYRLRPPIAGQSEPPPPTPRIAQRPHGNARRRGAE